jgi:hypothetical protein
MAELIVLLIAIFGGGGLIVWWLDRRDEYAEAEQLRRFQEAMRGGGLDQPLPDPERED